MKNIKEFIRKNAYMVEGLIRNTKEYNQAIERVYRDFNKFEENWKYCWSDEEREEFAMSEWWYDDIIKDGLPRPFNYLVEDEMPNTREKFATYLALSDLSEDEGTVYLPASALRIFMGNDWQCDASDLKDCLEYEEEGFCEGLCDCVATLFKGEIEACMNGMGKGKAA